MSEPTYDEIQGKILMHDHDSGDIVNDDSTGYVTLNTQQTITAQKTHNADIRLKQGKKLIFEG